MTRCLAKTPKKSARNDLQRGVSGFGLFFFFCVCVCVGGWVGGGGGLLGGCACVCVSCLVLRVPTPLVVSRGKPKGNRPPPPNPPKASIPRASLASAFSSRVAVLVFSSASHQPFFVASALAPSEVLSSTGLPVFRSLAKSDSLLLGGMEIPIKP